MKSFLFFTMLFIFPAIANAAMVDADLPLRHGRYTSSDICSKYVQENDVILDAKSLKQGKISCTFTSSRSMSDVMYFVKMDCGEDGNKSVIFNIKGDESFSMNLNNIPYAGRFCAAK